MVINFNGSFIFTLTAKLKALKSYLKILNKEVFDKVEVGKDMTLNQVAF